MSKSARTSGPWVDVHSHPGRCFLSGLDPEDPFARALGGEDTFGAHAACVAAGMAAVSFATVSDVRVLGIRADGGLGARREFEPGEVYEDHLRQLNAIVSLARADDIAIVRTAADIGAAHRSGAVAMFITCEGADFVENDFSRVDEAHAAGVRSITIVHYRRNGFGDLQTEPAVHGGLSGAGRRLVTEMNRVGMIVDLAHATFETTRDAVETSTHPLMISHTHLARGDTPHPRLVTDAHARVVAEAGGLIGAWPSGVSSETFDDFVDEIARLADVVGVEHVAIGTDMDANYKPVMTAYGEFRLLESGLASRGFSQPDIDRVLGGNAVGLIKTVCG